MTKGINRFNQYLLHRNSMPFCLIYIIVCEPLRSIQTKMFQLTINGLKLENVKHKKVYI